MTDPYVVPDVQINQGFRPASSAQAPYTQQNVVPLVVEEIPVITSPSTASGRVGVFFSYQITATSNPFIFGATNLPEGLSVDVETGLITGTPTADAVTDIAISAANATGAGYGSVTLTVVNQPPVITSADSDTAQVGVEYTYDITATNDPTSFNATNLPDGLSVDTSTGVISGTPTTPGSTVIDLSATNDGGTGHGTLTLDVLHAVPVITSPTTDIGQIGIPYSYQITATNDPTSFGASPLPSGLSVDTSTGLISGTPSDAGVTDITLSATNDGGTGDGPLTLTVVAYSLPVIVGPFTNVAQVGQFYAYQIIATNSPTSYGATNLPAGISIDTTTGYISGTIQVPQTSEITISATNIEGTATATLELRVPELPPGVALWMRASDNLFKDGATNWLDKSQNAFNYAGIGTPTKITDADGTEWASGFSATAYFENSENPSFTADDGAFVVAKIRPTSVPVGVNGIIWGVYSGGSPPNASECALAYGEDGLGQFYEANEAPTASTIETAIQLPLNVRNTLHGRHNTIGPVISIEQSAQSEQSQAGVSSALPSAGPARIGTWANGASQFFTGDIAEVIEFQFNPDSPSIAAARQHLDTAYSYPIMYTSGNGTGIAVSSDLTTFRSGIFPGGTGAGDSVYSSYYQRRFMAFQTMYASSFNGYDWTPCTALPSSNNSFSRVAFYKNIMWVAAVPGNVTTFVSNDGGVTWETGAAVGYTETQVLIAGSENQGFLMVHGLSNVTHSFDGISTTTVTIPGGSYVGNDSVRNINGTWYLAGQTSGSPYIIYSTDLITWTVANVPTGGSWNSGGVTAIETDGLGTWVVVGWNGDTAYSKDGMQTWTNMAKLTSTVGIPTMAGLRYSIQLGAFVCTGISNTLAYLRDPAVGWVVPSTFPSGSGYNVSISCKPPALADFIVAPGADGFLLSSWSPTRHTINPLTPGLTTPLSITWADGLSKFVLVGGQHAATSPDGIDWTVTEFTHGGYLSVAGIGDLLWAVSNATGYSSTSTDGGATWAELQNIAVSSGSLAMAAGNGVFILTASTSGDVSQYFYTTDGVTVNELGSAPSIYCWTGHGLTFAGGQFVCAGNPQGTGSDQAISTSPDGFRWTSQNAPGWVADAIASIETDGEGRWLAAGVFGAAAYSLDDMNTWTDLPSLGYTPRQIVYSPGSKTFTLFGTSNSINYIKDLASGTWLTPQSVPAGSGDIDCATVKPYLPQPTFLAIGNDGICIARDHTRFIQRPNAATAASPYCIVYSDYYQCWFAANTDTITFSTDGYFWQNCTALPANVTNCTSVAVLGDIILACSIGSGWTAVSTDGGVTWSQNANIPQSPNLMRVAASETCFLLFCEVPGSQTIVYRSTDGITVTEIGPFANLNMGQPKSSTSAGGIWGTVGSSLGTGNYCLVCRSLDDGMTWEEMVTYAWSNLAASIAGDGHGTWIVVGAAGDAIYSTDNMATWTAMENLGFRAYQVTYSKSQRTFIVVGENKNIRWLKNPAMVWNTPELVPTGTSDLLGVCAIDYPIEPDTVTVSITNAINCETCTFGAWANGTWTLTRQNATGDQTYATPVIDLGEGQTGQIELTMDYASVSGRMEVSVIYPSGCNAGWSKYVDNAVQGETTCTLPTQNFTECTNGSGDYYGNIAVVAWS